NHYECYEDGALCVTLSNGLDESICGRDCRVDSDCPNSFVCVDLLDANGRQCIPQANTCSGIAVECQDDRDCAVGEVCDSNNSCQPDMTGCTADADCSAGRICEDGACIIPPPECDSTTTCPSGQYCDGGVCVEGAECDAMRPCSGGHVCEIGSCVASRCDANEDCMNGSL